MTRIACVQLSLVADEASNLKKCLGLIDRAAAEKPELIVLPEMSNWSGGLVRSRAEALEHGTPVPGPFLDALGERAERHGCFIAAGVIERLGDESFITSVILDPDRRIVLKYQNVPEFRVNYHRMDVELLFSTNKGSIVLTVLDDHAPVGRPPRPTALLLRSQRRPLPPLPSHGPRHPTPPPHGRRHPRS